MFPSQCLQKSLEKELESSAVVLGDGTPYVVLAEKNACAGMITLVVEVAPTAEWPQGWPKFPLERRFKGTLRRRYDTPITPELYASVFGKVVSTKPACVDEAEARKQLAQGKRALKALPQSWFVVSNKGGTLTREKFCDYEDQFLLLVEEEKILLRYEGPEAREEWEVLAARSQDGGLVLDTRTGATWTLTFPLPGQADAGRFVCPGASFTLVPKAKARRFPLRDLGCPAQTD